MEQQKELAACIDRLEEVFQQMIRRLHAELDHHLAQGITGSQFFVMKRIERRGRMMVSEMAGDMGVSLSAITALVDRLHKAGFVRRVRDDSDRRVVWLEVTPEGREVLQSCQLTRRRILEKFLGQLPLADVGQLVHIYEKLLSVIQREGGGITTGRGCCAPHQMPEEGPGDKPG